MKTELKEKIETLRKHADETIKTSREMLTKLNETKAQLIAGLKENLQENNTTAYIQNSQKLNETETLIDYHNKLIQNAINAPLITPEQYNAALLETFAELDQLTAEAAGKISELAKKAQQIRDEANSRINEANAALRDLQLNCLKDASVFSQNGRIIEPLIKRYTKYVSAHFKD